jgi:DDE family transposase
VNIIDQERQRTKDKILDALLHPIRPLLPTALLEGWCRELDYDWRERVFGPVVTVLACVWKHLQSQVASARAVEDAVAVWSGNGAASLRDGSDFCQARKRVPLAVFQRALEHVGGRASQAAGSVFKGLRVALVDGSTLRTANTRALEEHFGRSRNATRASRSPLVRLLLLVCAGSGAVLNVATGVYADSEQVLFMQLLAWIQTGALLVADRAYGSFLLCSLVAKRGSHLLARVRAERSGKRLCGLGYRDKLVLWTRPKPAHTAWPILLAQCSETLVVRVLERSIQRKGYKTWTLTLVTTLTNAEQYPADELVALYLRRWEIETVLRTLKTHYQMARLAGKTPDVVEKELRSAILAYNCVTALMAQSRTAPRLLSPVRVRGLVVQYAGYMAFLPTLRLVALFKEMLQLIANAFQLPQARGPEPRAVIQRPGTFPVLMMSRRDWKRKYWVA